MKVVRAINFNNAVINIRRLINEPSASVWSNNDIFAFYKEALRRIKTGTKLLSGITIPASEAEELNIPSDFSDVPDLFAASRCFEQDKQYYEAAQKMNEFETKRSDMIDFIEENPSNAVLPVGKTIDDSDYQSEYVTDNYSDGPYDAGEDEVI